MLTPGGLLLAHSDPFILAALPLLALGRRLSNGRTDDTAAAAA